MSHDVPVLDQGATAGNGSPRTVLVVDDDDAVRTVVRWQLEADGHEVVEASDGGRAVDLITGRRPDLVVLDLSLPTLGGLDVLRHVRRAEGADDGLPIIVLSGRDGESDRILGLDLGADDYLVKPFSPGELGARVRSLLRRTTSPERRLSLGAITLDLAARSATVRGEAVELTAKEFDLLTFLVGHPSTVFTREQLLHRVWQASSAWLGEATVTEHVHRLRRKIEEDPGRPAYIKTARGIGYQMEAADG